MRLSHGLSLTRRRPALGEGLLLDQYPGAEVALSLRKLRQGFGSEGAAGPDLSLTNNGVTQGEGKVGNAGVFEAANNDNLSASSGEDFQPEKAYTVEAWVKIDDKSTTRSIFGKRTAFNDGFHLDYHQPSDSFQLIHGYNGNWFLGNTISPNLGQWYHVVAGWDGYTLFIYADAANEDTASVAGITNSSENIQVGSALESDNWWDGKIGPVRFWNGRALTPTEISTLYNGGNGLSLTEIKTQEPQLLDDLVAAYEFEDTTNLGKDSFVIDGPVIRARRGSDDVERLFGFDPATGVVDEQELVDFANGGNVWVPSWVEQSGNTNDADQSTLADQPRIVNGGAVEKEGSYPGVRFTADSQRLGFPDNVTISGAGFALLAVCYFHASASQDTSVLGVSGSGATEYIVLRRNASGNLVLGSNGETSGSGSAVPTNQLTLLAAHYDGTDFSVRLDGAEDYSITPSGSNWQSASIPELGNLSASADAAPPATIFEGFVYTDISFSDFQSLEADVLSHYSI